MQSCSCDRLIIPVHQEAPYKHWSVLLVDLQQRRLVFFDSLTTPNPVAPRAMARVKQWLAQEAQVNTTQHAVPQAACTATELSMIAVALGATPALLGQCDGLA